MDMLFVLAFLTTIHELYAVWHILISHFLAIISWRCRMLFNIPSHRFIVTTLQLLVTMPSSARLLQ